MASTEPQRQEGGAMAQALMAEFEQEMAGTRRALERVPFDKADWVPHEKSMTLGRLACHIAEMPGWGASIRSAPGPPDTPRALCARSPLRLSSSPQPFPARA